MDDNPNGSTPTPSCGLCQDCALKLSRVAELIDRLMDPTSPLCYSHQLDKLDAIRADLGRLLPLADLLDQLTADDGQVPGVLGMLKLAMGRG